MSRVPYTLVDDERGELTLSLFIGGVPAVVKGDHPNFDELLDIAQNPEQQYDGVEDKIRTLADPAETVRKNMTALSERVAVFGGVVYFDGDPIGSVLTDHIVRLLDEGKERGENGWQALVNFLEKLAANPIPHSQSRLYGWLQAYNADDLTNGFTIAEDGDIIGYKGVDVNLRSVQSGPGIVNGEQTNGHLDNSIGNVVEIARSTVEHNPAKGCSSGLHIGTRSYAESWGPRVVTVKFSPRDVVSVPTDSGDAKMRVCRYEVIDADAPVINEPVYSLGD